MKTFRLFIDDSEFTFHHDGDARLSLNGAACDTQLHVVSDGHYALRLGNRMHDVRLDERSLNDGQRTLSIVVDGIRSEVRFESARDALAKRFGFTTQSTHKHSEVRAPMPGLITKIFVREGEEIKQGQRLLLLEAMKMENEIRAPADGIIAAVRVSERLTVDKNALLIELE